MSGAGHWLGVAVAVAIAFVGCGGGSDTTGSGGQSASSGHPSGGGGPGPGSGGAGGGGTGGQSTHPIAGARLFYSDLVSGPNQGGQGDDGAFVTVYGNGFGSSKGSSTVTVGGGAASSYPIWSETKITFQLGHAAKTGDVVIHVAGKDPSNALPFTVRSGNVFFVTASGSDGADGSFAHPWKTILFAKDSLAQGDIAYLGASAGDSVSLTTETNYNSSLSMEKNDGTNAGTADRPKALIAYPGATVTIGAETGIERGILTPAITGVFDYWVIAGLTVRGEIEALDFEGSAKGWRVVGNDFSCPNGTGLAGCVNGDEGTPTNLAFFGNVVHDAASSVADGAITKYYHGIYFGSNHLELGWNVVRDGKTCRGIQFHDSEGNDNFDLSVHDNLVHGTVCDGINFATVDPSQGAVRAWNNVVYDVGRGPDPSDGSSSYACIYVANITNFGPPGQGDVELFNNTLYDCGSRGTSAAGAISLTDGPVGIQMDDNLIALLANESYFSGDSQTSKIHGSNNLFSGAGAPPGGLTGSVGGDPKLADPTGHDFHLTKGSAAIDAGIATAAKTDFDGVVRPAGAGFDIGAFELAP